MMLGQTIGVRYKILKYLGGGGFGQTYLAEDAYIPDHALCVVKHLKPQSSDPFTLQTSRRLFDSEARILHKLGDHSQIPRLLAHFEENQEFYLVQEFVEGHDLSHEIVIGQQYSEPQVVKLLWDILEVLNFVHQNHAIHRDLKPSNIMRRMQDGKLVLIDFGAVKQISTQIVNAHGQTQRSVAIGTRGFAAPELLGGKPHWASDIYAVGMIGIQALTGIFPLDLDFDLQTGEVVWRNKAQVSPTLADILDGMVRYDYRQRYQNTIVVMEALQPIVSHYHISTPSPQAFAIQPPASYPPQIAATPQSLPPTVPASQPPQSVFSNPQASVSPSVSPQTAPLSSAGVHSPTHPTSVPPTVLHPSIPPALPLTQVAPSPATHNQLPVIAPISIPSTPSTPPILSSQPAQPTALQSEPPSSPPTMTFGHMSPATAPEPITAPKSRRSAQGLWWGTGIAVATLGLGVGGWQFVSSAQLQSAIAALETLKTQGQFQECIRQAQALSQQPEAQMLLGDCQLGQAKQLAQKKDFKGAIAQAQQIAADHSAHGQAQTLIGESFKGILTQATQFAQTGKLKDAIAAAGMIPTSNSAYAEAQKRIGEWSGRILTIAQQQYEKGKREDAVALAKVIPSSSSKSAEAQQAIQRWETEWKTDQATYNRAKKAYENNDWQLVLSEVDKLKNPYWQQQANAWVNKAETEIAKAAPRSAPTAPAGGGYVQPASASHSEPYYAPEPYYPPAPAYNPPPEPYYPPEPAYSAPPEPEPAAPIQVPQSDSSACGGGAC